MQVVRQNLAAETVIHSFIFSWLSWREEPGELQPVSPDTHRERRVSPGQENIQTQTTSGDVMVEAESLTVHVNKSVFGHLGDGHCDANLWPSHSELIAVAATQNNNNNIYLGQRPKQEEITRGKQAGIQPTTTLMGNKKERTRFLLKRSNKRVQMLLKKKHKDLKGRKQKLEENRGK